MNLFDFVSGRHAKYVDVDGRLEKNKIDDISLPAHRVEIFDRIFECNELIFESL